MSAGTVVSKRAHFRSVETLVLCAVVCIPGTSSGGRGRKQPRQFILGHGDKKIIHPLAAFGSQNSRARPTAGIAATAAAAASTAAAAAESLANCWESFRRDAAAGRGASSPCRQPAPVPPASDRTSSSGVFFGFSASSSFSPRGRPAPSSRRGVFCSATASAAASTCCEWCGDPCWISGGPSPTVQSILFSPPGRW